MEMIDPDTSYNEISDELIIEEFAHPKKFKPTLLYALMAKRANSNRSIRELLFDVITDKRKRRERFLNTLPHSWIPVLYILEHGTEDLKIEMRNQLKDWTNDEKWMFFNYIEKDESYKNFMEPLIKNLDSKKTAK